MADFSAQVYDITTSGAEFWAVFSGGDESYAKARYVKIVMNGKTYQVTSNESSGGYNTFEYIFTGLSSGTKYTWTATLGYLGSSGSIVWTTYTATGSFTTLTSEVVISPWSWTKSNGSATATQTNNAYKVLQGTLTVDNFSYKVWNDIVDKVVEVLDKEGYGWRTTYATYANTKVAAGDTLSAKIFNSVKCNIDRCHPTGIAYVSAGDPITGSHIIALTNAINNAI